MNIKFGFSQLKEKTPMVFHWISVTGATLLTAMAATQVLYPQFITESVIAETAKVLALVRIIGQFFGTQPTTQDETTTNKPI
jgi:hypothetical protein